MATKEYCVYIMTNKYHTTLYTGVTNDLCRRVHEHKEHLIKGFTDRYYLEKLVFFEVTGDIGAAILREKQIKGGSRKKNSHWEDIYFKL